MEQNALVEKSLSMAIGVEIGNIYYDYNEELDDFDMVRIIGIQNGETAKCKITMANGESYTKKMKLVDIKSKYHPMCSHAIMTVSKVQIGVTPSGEPIHDIVIMVFKKDGPDDTFTYPDIVCRQAMSDIFYEPFCNQQENPYVGLSVTKDTVPAGYSMRDMIACDNVEESIIVNLVKDDTLDTICEMIKPEKWNNTLLSVATRAHQIRKMKNPFLGDEIPDMEFGYCKDIRTLMESNNFMYDFYSLFGITKVNFVIEYNPDMDGLRQCLPIDQKELLEHLYQINMSKTIIVPFDYAIDPDMIRLPHVFIMDGNDRLYIIGYLKSPDEYVQIVDTGVSEEALKIKEKLHNAVTMYEKYSNQ